MSKLLRGTFPKTGSHRDPDGIPALENNKARAAPPVPLQGVGFLLLQSWGPSPHIHPVAWSVLLIPMPGSSSSR
eukprot:5631745-Pyramimonas_sp.AAC.1